MSASESQLSVSPDPRLRTQGMETTILRTLGTIFRDSRIFWSIFCDLELGTI